MPKKLVIPRETVEFPTLSVTQCYVKGSDVEKKIQSSKCPIIGLSMVYHGLSIIKK